MNDRYPRILIYNDSLSPTEIKNELEEGRVKTFITIVKPKGC